MKILMVSSYLPYPLYSGGYIRLYNLMKNLSRNHEITLICELRKNQREQDLREVSKICKRVITVGRRPQWSISNVLKSAVSLDPFLITGHTSGEMKKLIESQLSQEKYDLIHVETFYVMQNLPKVRIPVVLTEHNVEYMVYERYKNKARLLLKPLLFVDIAKIKRIEKGFWKKADKVVAVSPQEAQVMNADAVVPNGVDLEKFSAKKIVAGRTAKKVLFIGDFNWVQNRDTAVFIIKNIWPRILSQNKKLDLKLWIVGRKIPDSIKQLGSPSIIFDEDAPDETQLIFQSADLLLAPLRVAGGTSYKILESMACGTPVITTPLGNEGIDAGEGQIIVCKTPEEFAKETLSILSDDYLYEKLSRNGRLFIENNFGWQKISKKLEKVYEEALLKK